MEASKKHHRHGSMSSFLNDGKEHESGDRAVITLNPNELRNARNSDENSNPFDAQVETRETLSNHSNGQQHMMEENKIVKLSSKNIAQQCKNSFKSLQNMLKN